MCFRVRRTPERRLDEPPQRHESERGGGNPQRDVATALAGDGRQRSRRVRVPAAAAERNPDGEVSDDEMQEAAHHVSGAGESLEDAVLREPRDVGGRVHRLGLR